MEVNAYSIWSFFYFDLIDTQLPEIPDLQDLAFAIHENSFQAPFLTRELKKDDIIICENGKEKFILKSESIAEFDKERYYLCSGTVQNKIVNGMFLACANALHCDLKFLDYDSDGNALLRYPCVVIYDQWAGLSGGPILDDQFRLVGMLISVCESDNTVLAVPIRKILKLMDSAIMYEEQELKLKQQKKTKTQ